MDVEGHSLAEIATALRERTPAGFELTHAPVRMEKGSAALTATFARVDGMRDIDADDMATLRGKVPDGWQLL